MRGETTEAAACVLTSSCAQDYRKEWRAAGWRTLNRKEQGQSP